MEKIKYKISIRPFSTELITEFIFVYSARNVLITVEREIEILSKKSECAFVVISSYDSEKSIVRDTIFGSVGDHLESAKL